MDALHLELEAPATALAPLQVVAQPSIFREPTSRISKAVPHGATLLDLVLDTGMGEWRDGTVQLPGKVVCTIDGNLIEREYWHRVRPRPGRLVNIYLVPQGQREAILIGGALAIAALAIVAPYSLGITGTMAGAFLTAGIAIGGNIALTMLVPPQEENIATEGPQGSSAVTGDANQLVKNAIVPVVLARSTRVVPRHWAKPYTEAAGTDTYWRMLLVFGQGPLEITDIRAGDTLLSANPDAYDYQVREGRLSDPAVTLFTRDITELNPSNTLGEVFASTPQVQTMEPGSTEGTADIAFPQGIFHQGKMNRDAYTVVYALERRVSPAGSWVDFETGGGVQLHTRRYETSNFMRFSHRATGLNPANTYDVRVRRTNGDGGTSNPSAMFWTALRSIQPNDPRPDKTLACIAIRAKKTGSGSVPVISATCGTYAPEWNGSAWVEDVTGNPASLGRLLLQDDQYNPNPVGDERIDLPSWQDFHEHCEAEGFVCNLVLDDEGTVGDRLPVVLAAGRGRLIPPETKYAVAIDRNGKTLSGMITPRNSSGFKGYHFLRDQVQALRCLFINEATWQEDERLVFADGYDENNVEDGRIESYDMTRSGITDPDLVWRFGRWRLADMALRLDVYEVTQGYEYLQHVVGDLVAFQHHVPLLGLTRGRIKTITTSGSPAQVTGCTIDDLVTMEVGKTYATRVRLIDDSGTDQFVERAVTTVPGSGYTLAFPTPFAASAAPKIGDLLSFGETSLATINCLIKEIIPGPDKSARVVLVDEAPAVNEADTGTIPPFTSFITLPGDFFGIAPAVPVIQSIVVHNISHPSQPDIITQQQVIVHLAAVGSQLPPATGYELQIKRDDQEIYQRQVSYPPDTAELAVENVPSKALYDIRVRATGRSPRGIPNESAWSAVSQIFVPLPQVTFSTVAAIAGLELQGQGNDTTFEGPDAHFVWRIVATSGAFSMNGIGEQQLLGYTDPQFAWFEIEIIDPATSYLRRTETTATPQFVYTLADNKEDSRKQSAALGGSTKPLRRFTARVHFVDRFGRRGAPQSLTVSNPAPAAPGGLIVSGKVLAINVRTDPPDDDDFDGTIVWVGDTSGFNPAALPPNRVFKDFNNTVLVADQPGGVTKFVRVAHADRFSQEVADLNLSSEIAVVIEAPDGPPRFTVEGIVFKPNAATNRVSWTAGTVYVLDGATVTPEAVIAGTATWTTGTLWLYYVRGFGSIQATTNAALANQPDRVALAIYRGGRRLTRTNGDIPIANLVTIGAGGVFSGNGFLGGTITIETAGNPVDVTVTARVSQNGRVLGTSATGDLSASISMQRDGTTIRTISVAFTRGTSNQDLAVAWAGDLSFRDVPGDGVHSYRASVVYQSNQMTNLSSTAQLFAASAQEALY